MILPTGRMLAAGNSAAYVGGQVKGTHYLMADHIDGPWDVAPGPYMDGTWPCQRYAGRVVQHSDGRAYLLGFLHDDPDGNFIGQIADPQKIYVNENGLLGLSPSKGNER